MIRRDTLFRRDVTEHRIGFAMIASHAA
jgi:hypothetical protein